MKQSTLPPVTVSRETIERLESFASLVTWWSKRINLISRADVSAIWSRHIEDSLQLASLISGYPPPAVDLGSGAGFPGLVLAIATGHIFHLVEADQRKVAFLREAIRLTDAPAIVHARRIEELKLPPVSLVTARALAPLSTLLGYAMLFLQPCGECLFLKGRTANAELTHAEPKWHMRVTQWQSRTDPEARILQLSEIALVKPCGESSLN